ncbi:hypothetical protein [Mycobacterium intracellulare]|uniref:hypothetical protein n=1 Tax=Mycobacterium intracellulare TaxID=1767 RepID=UPI0012F4F3D7|nr:hypothetical protein [Mycobacterium intracellulare]UGU07997.1 hypothetical protein LTQ56_04755 [Mycobacterium intracellulare subsp. intracellulare]BCO56995.1 hypothetical protein MINTM005_22390 [Mycobacterium intracellulare]BCO67520.1 hypothetical protein MINTM007_21310 [Mycobacterium intracellulare]BCO73053.1 hypothetical protein MINTM008_23880 [Mycobacterium intracellulare]BCO78494.1 hypothetical protein MINTM009_22760 [Mycobacterium intracellulare]
MTSPIAAGFLAAGIPADLVTDVIEAYEEAKTRFHRRDYRPSSVEGARFSEAVFRILQWATSGSYAPIGGSGGLPPIPQLIQQLQNATGVDDSVRIHIPRTLQAVYDIRNRRNVAHLGNIAIGLQDSGLVVHILDWVMTELVRLYHNVPAAEAQEIIEDIVKKEVPAIQVIDGFPRLLKDVPGTDHILLLLYREGAGGVDKTVLRGWIPQAAQRYFTRNLGRLDQRHCIHQSGERIFLTDVGIAEVENKGLLDPL